MKQSTDPQQHALIVDDEPDIRELLALTLSQMGLTTSNAADLSEAKGLLNSESFDLCITDMRLPDGNGIELVRHIQHHQPQMPVAMITAHGNMNTAIEALKAGAFDFLNKPVELKTLRTLVTTALKLSRRGGLNPEGMAQQLLGESQAMDDIRATITKLARSQAPVYISGESGTGKELVARLIHAHGARAASPFIAVNCGAIPEELMESELFGYKKGSFTGANRDKEGLFQGAHGGTLFLDEVADLPLSMQVKLLRAIQEKAVRPVGGVEEIPIDVRILSATHKALGELVAMGEFREDLFYRINVIEFKLPALRERPEDIPLLANHLMARQQSSEQPLELSAAALESLSRYPFPGNVRELENILERAATLCDERVIDSGDLMLPSSGEIREDPDSAIQRLGLEAYLEEVERKALTEALERYRYNKTAAAQALGLTFRSLRYRLKKLGME